MSGLPAANELSTAANQGVFKTSLENQRNVLAELIGGSAKSELTIATGSITPTSAMHSVGTEADAATDDLANILTTNHPDGRILMINVEDVARKVVVKHQAGGAGQIKLTAGADITLDNTDKIIYLRRVGADWHEILSLHSLTSGTAINTSRATVASHATMSAIWAAAGNEINFTGTETLTDLPVAPRAGAIRILHCAGACVFTNNANLSVQGATNFTASSGDIVLVHALTTTTFRLAIFKADGTPITIKNLSEALNGQDKTLSRVNLKDYGEITNAMGNLGATPEFNIENGNSITGTVDQIITSSTMTNPTASDEMCGFVLTLTNGGAFGFVFPTNWDWGDVGEPTLTTSGRDTIVGKTVDGGTNWDVMVTMQGGS